MVERRKCHGQEDQEGCAEGAARRGPCPHASLQRNSPAPGSDPATGDFEVDADAIDPPIALCSLVQLSLSAFAWLAT
jgi:hypothetical protein